MTESAIQRVSNDQALLDKYGFEPFTTFDAKFPFLGKEETKGGRKICSSLEDAIRRSGLKDGDTITFHHHFREGDKVILMVLDELARLGYKDLTLAPSSLNSCHARVVEHIRSGLVRRIYSSGMRGKLAEEISHGLMDEPVINHSHGGRVALIQTGELKPNVAFLGVPMCDTLGNANGTSGAAKCGVMGYAMVDAQYAETVVMLTEEIVAYPHTPASIRQDQVDWIVKVDSVGDPKEISTGAARLTTNPRELLIARYAADVMEFGGYFNEGYSMQTGAGAAPVAVTQFLGPKMAKKGIKGRWALGGITGAMVDLYEQGYFDALVDTQDFDVRAIDHVTNPGHHEISASEYANPLAKGTAVDELDMVILAALEIDLNFNVNVLTGSDGIMLGASGGHSDTAAGAKLAIIVAPLLRGRIPMVVENVTTLITPGENIGVLVTDYGVAVNPNRPDVHDRLKAAGLPMVTIEQLHDLSNKIAGKPRPLEFGDKVVGIVRYRDGSVIDTVREVLR